MWEELFNGLTEERIAKEEGVELTEEQLEAVSDGGCTPPETPCQRCVNLNAIIANGDDGPHRYDCDYSW